MTLNQIQYIINDGICETLELKQSLTKTVMETIVAFSNTIGGQVLIGVKNVEFFLFRLTKIYA